MPIELAQRKLNLLAFYDEWNLVVNEEDCRSTYSHHHKQKKQLPANLSGRQLWAEYTTDLFTNGLPERFWMELDLYDNRFDFCVMTIPTSISFKRPDGYYDENEEGIIAFIRSFVAAVYGSKRVKITDKSFLRRIDFKVKGKRNKEFIFQTDGCDNELALLVYKR
jgi:hypothetical protein